MKVVVGNKKVTLADADLLGVGGEARVYRCGDRALKIYHAGDPALHDAKIAKLRAFPRVPAAIVAPVELVFDPKGAAIGFAMPIVQGAKELLHLSRRPFREGAYSNDAVVRLFRRLHQALRELHASAVIAGDLNDGNVLFAGEHPWVIDADSMQFGGHLCVVAHERFLDPRFYGCDLTASAVFDQASDWYAFAVMLVSCLLYVHPYGGTHPKYPTLLRRAEAQHSVLKPDVKYPKTAVHFRILPDDVLAFFEQMFDHGWRGLLPETLLDLTWTRCKCGLEHARAICPDCASRGTVVARPAVRHHGTCRAISVKRTHGRILFAVLQGSLRYLYEEDGVIRREDGARVADGPCSAGVRFAISGPTTWVGLGRRLIGVEREIPRVKFSINEGEGEPAFDANESGCVRVEHDWLVEGEGARVGPVLEGRTWIRCGERLGFGFYRAGLTTFYFLFRPGRAGLTDVRLPAIEGRLIEVDAQFDGEHVLFTYVADKGGRRVSRMYLIGANGAVRGRLEDDAGTQRVLRTARGKCVFGGRMLSATEDGLVALEVDSGIIVERALFADTEPFVAEGADVLPGPAGSVYVVTTKEITQLVLA
jgi:hypothetical protein